MRAYRADIVFVYRPVIQAGHAAVVYRPRYTAAAYTGRAYQYTGLIDNCSISNNTAAVYTGPVIYRPGIQPLYTGAVIYNQSTDPNIQRPL